MNGTYQKYANQNVWHVNKYAHCFIASESDASVQLVSVNYIRCGLKCYKLYFNNIL